MQPFTVALLQMTAAGNDRAANQAKGDDFCRRAAAMGADVALFPEMWSVGYTAAITWDPDDELWRHPAQWPEPPPEGRAAQPLVDMWQDLAVGRDGPFVAHFRELARRAGYGDRPDLPGTVGWAAAQRRLHH